MIARKSGLLSDRTTCCLEQGPCHHFFIIVNDVFFFPFNDLFTMHRGVQPAKTHKVQPISKKEQPQLSR
ncbi:hypothetical protein, partial [Pseudomonas syringae]|uniref:hypothetical protein n=1 Tax=Pseudomonas syringae TaxID=317 RepID=UPI001E6150BA